MIEPHLPLDAWDRRREVEVARLVVEVDPERLLRSDDAAQLVDEIHVPGGAPELAVRRGAQAGLLLHLHRLADRLVLDLAEPLPGKAPVRDCRARFEKLLRPEEAADVIGAKRRSRRRSRHCGPQSRGSFTSGNFSNSTLKSRPSFFSTRRT